ncbi:MAG: class I SAM-dependent RNA methyltransferase [Gemmatimonadales bacterium]
MTSAGPVVTIRSIAAGGDGVARLPDGRAVFVPRTAPGDEVLLRDVQLHARFARATIAEVLVPATSRVDPPCRHYLTDRCGGCQLMHLDPAAQRTAKSGIAGDALRRIARRDVADPVVVPSPVEFGYRNKVTFAVRSARIGYHRLHQPDVVFDVVECLIAAPRLRQLHDAVRTARALLPPSAVRLTLRLDRAGRVHLIVATAGDNAWTGAAALRHALSAAVPDIVIWWHPEDGAPRAMAGADDPWPATVFEQVHPAVADAVRRLAIDWMGDVQSRIVWDLYAGIGESTTELTRRGAEVESIERDRLAVELAERLAPGVARRHVGAVEDIVGRLPAASAILTNPPRIGMAEPVIAGIQRSPPLRLVYVSCDPATLARDIHRLGDGFQLTAVRAFDQFPQTAHLETVVLLERR